MERVATKTIPAAEIGPRVGCLRIYLAARYSRHPEMRQVAHGLRLQGHVVTSRWIEGDHDLTGMENPAVASQKRQGWAEEDLADLLAADCCVSFTEPSGEAPGRNRGGRHVEFGVALAMGKRCVVVGHRENVFHCLPEVEFCAGIGPLLGALHPERGQADE